MDTHQREELNGPEATLPELRAEQLGNRGQHQPVAAAQEHKVLLCLTALGLGCAGRTWKWGQDRTHPSERVVSCMLPFSRRARGLGVPGPLAEQSKQGQ